MQALAVQLMYLLMPLPLDGGVFRHIWHRLLLCLFCLMYILRPYPAFMRLTFSARFVLSMCTGCLLVACSNPVTCLLMVGTQGYGPALLVDPYSLPFLPACFLQELVANIAGSDLWAKPVFAGLRFADGWCRTAVCLSNVLSQRSHDATSPEYPAQTQALCKPWCFSLTC